MTKFVLHGGFNKEKSLVQEDDEFFAEILRDVPDNAKILLVYFAEREDIVQLRTAQDKDQFGKVKGAKNLQFRIATEESFIEDCAWADTIYLHGGRTVKLMETLRKYKNLEYVFRDKTIAGDSAGVNALGRLFYSKTSKEIGDGLGILPYKVVVHHTDGATNPLADVQPETEILFLREYETKVLYQQ